MPRVLSIIVDERVIGQRSEYAVPKQREEQESRFVEEEGGEGPVHPEKSLLIVMYQSAKAFAILSTMP
jgi:hypothetical protein